MEIKYEAGQNDNSIKILLTGYSEDAAADVESCSEEVFALLQSYCESIETNMHALDTGDRNSKVGAALLMKARALLSFSLETSRLASKAFDGEVRGSDVGFPEFDED